MDTRRHRAYYTSAGTWRDPDCVECGGEGAPCCDPPDTSPIFLFAGAFYFLAWVEVELRGLDRLGRP